MDRNKLLSLFDGDVDLVDKFILNFRSESSRLIALMMGYLSEDNMTLFANCAHMLKAQAAYAGLDELSALAEQLDYQARTGEPVKHITTTFQALTAGLESIIE